MLRRHARAACTALVAAGMALAGLQAGTATAAPDGKPAAKTAARTLATAAAQPELLSAMQRDLGLTRPQALTRLANEAEAGATAAGLRQSLAGAFAGAWVDGAESGTLTVATTRSADTAAIRATGANARLVPHSLTALERAKRALDRGATAEAPVRYVDVRANVLVVEETRAGAGARLVEAAGVPRDLVRVVRTDRAPRPLYDIRGGDAYYMGGGGRCSVGFAVTRGATQGFATAGHCGRAGTTTSGFNQVAQGSFQASTFPGNDMAWVAANTNWTSTPYVKGSGGANVQVTGSVLQPVGASVCRSGSTTGWHCGTIQQHNTSVTYPEGTISGVTRTTVCAEPGDSGGSYISGSQAQGVTSGGSGNCSSGGTTFFQPLNPLLQNYGLTLKTTGTDPGPGPGEPQPGGTWAAGKVYAAGATVTYGGATYRCLQGHQAQTGWEPPNVPALWQRQ
ncbi:Putative serine protease [Streptomyces venezuelae]|uniref:carbohydrate-binding protein n=1 Tax=Streptomyces gardneri TaxID=66892 RepID=UPI0006BCF859|nr:carbohydrate-binding protein [Streptomyces gardneri]ALO12953.1 Putative serine protease [Streptomyces venezuelae]QPK49645.1 alpha-lytic protease prodomain-containing protein [Streptomyces gardneri]WRK41197.1 alpha-lytic protease prodomain-containing protein [Streptomyces venezuelae]CUM36384.1 serine protease precursor [Streptomyces venezuelae]